MIYQPQAWSEGSVLKSLPHHARLGTVLVFNPRARGPKNVLIKLDGGADVVVPRGNLRKEPPCDSIRSAS